MNDYAPAFATAQIIARIRGAIAQHRVSQAQLAAICDTSQSQFSKIIRGTRPMTLDQLVVLADALDLDLPAIIAEVDAKVFEADNRRSAAMIFVEEGITLADPIDVPAEFLDAYGRRALDRVTASDPAPTVMDVATGGDPMDEIEIHERAEGVKSAYGRAASRGRRKADQPHAE